MKSDQILSIVKSSISDKAFRLLIYSITTNISLKTLSEKQVLKDLGIPRTSFYRCKKEIEDHCTSKIDSIATVAKSRVGNGKIVELFNKFYKMYPRKMSKKNAEKAFISAIKRGAEPDDLIIAAEKYSLLTSERRTDTKFIPYPATWLNQEKWQDEDLSSFTSSISEADLAPQVL